MAALDVSHAVTSGQIARCEALIRPYIRRTPVVEIDAADIGLRPGKLSLKLELFQVSGSFKARGAFANLLTRKVPAAGVVAASGGNHGAAVAYAAMRLKTRAKIFIPSISSPAKVQRIREYGADLVVEGDGYADALAASEAWAQRTGAMRVHAFDQDETILGQGTIGLELDEQISGFDTLLASVGGGGLIAGLAAWYAGRIKVIGIEPSASPTLTRALQAGHPVDAEAGGLAADSLAPKRVGERVFPIARDYVRETILVSDAAISQAQHMLWNALRIVAEPGGAAAFSAVLSGAYQPQDGERVCIVISGGNTTAVNFDLTR
jgi:threonine dehydratase